MVFKMKNLKEYSSKWTWQFEDELIKNLDVEKPERCLQCGKCVGDCPAAFASPTYNPRRILMDIFFGHSNILLKSEEIWDCFLCYNCMSICPESIEIPNIIQELRKAALEKSYGYDLICNLEDIALNFINTGSIFFNKSLKDKRKKLGLTEERIINSEMVEKLKLICNITGFSNTVQKLNCEKRKHEKREIMY
ncbi:MAG: hypothetical protein EAX96_08535 [Candidatus Lokiarchaeota archaeon]|nr:hypothetical protein [Candidatus Lokiarchaeota archaeon]